MKKENLIVLIQAWYSRGVSCESIAKYLNREGITTKDGGKWRATTVKRVCDGGEGVDPISPRRAS